MVNSEQSRKFYKEGQFSVTGSERRELKDRPEELTSLERRMQDANYKVKRDEVLKLITSGQKRAEALESITSRFGDWSKNDFETQLTNANESIAELMGVKTEYLDGREEDELNDVIFKLRSASGAINQAYQNSFKQRESKKVINISDKIKERKTKETVEAPQKSGFGAKITGIFKKLIGRRDDDDNNEQMQKAA